MEKQNDQIKQIQDNFEQSMSEWTDAILEFEIKTDELKILPFKYNDELLMNTTILFRHALFNIGFHRSLINAENAEELGNDLHLLIKKYSGIDTKEFYKK